MTRRFHVDAGTISEARVHIEGDLAHRMMNVMRLRGGDEMLLFDGSGSDARVRIDSVVTRTLTATVLERIPGPREPYVRVHLYQSITKGERFEWLIEKGTEIGVGRFVPLLTARSVVRTSGETAKTERWRRIAVEAAEQCERSAIPEISAPMQFDEAVATAPGIVVLPYEDAPEDAPTVQRALDVEIDALMALNEVSILIGPEGGYDPAEVERARDAGAAIVTMGTRVLRSETAGLVAATLVMHAIGELG